MGVGSTTGRKMNLYAEGGPNIMGDTRIHGIAAADKFVTPSDEQLKDAVDTVDNKMRLDIRANACEKRY